jgi:hypothetical protein
MTDTTQEGPPTVQVNFETDALYFTEAVRQSAQLPPLEAGYAEKRRQTEDLNSKIREIEARHDGDSAAAYDDAEGYVIQLVDSVFVELDHAARPLAGASAAIQILCAASLEAHINIRAAATLSGALYKEFERTSLGGKWLLYPALHKLAGLDAGTAVLGGVQALVKRRNALAHPKRERTEGSLGFQTPDFLERGGLTGEDARGAVAAARAAVSALADAEGRSQPAWLNGHGPWSLFSHEWDRTGA